MARKIEVAKQATFDTDDKRAQYARLVVFNHGVGAKLIPKTKDVNSATNAELSKAVNDLAGGTLIEGKDGIELIQKLSAKGSTTGRALTVAYAQEVRPFIKRKTLSAAFGRRKGERKPKAEGTTNTPKRAASKRSTAKRSTAKRAAARGPKAAPAES